ncbi:MAG TPA: GAP family protein [Candidatus Limnocylindrales bacterium]|nr:GAP family protein [Candidatus Limnocylindrales bacterium]
MTDLWTILVPLAVGSALIPIEIALTVVVLRAPGGIPKALAWVGGMTAVRLAQLAIVGPVVEAAVDDGEPGTSVIEAAFLLLVGVLFLVIAARKATNQPDEDAPPPAWMTLMDGVSAGRAFLMGAAVIGLNPKLWAFTIAALGAIGDAELGVAASVGVFVVFVIAAQSVHLAAIGVSVVAPERSRAMLDGMNAWLERHSRALLIGLSLVFGLWLVVRSLTAFGIL